MPMGMPGWPESAFCTASMASVLMAFAMSWWVASGNASPCCKASAISISRLQNRLIGPDAHRRLDGVVADEKLRQRKRVAPRRAVGDVDPSNLVAQMPRFRDEVPQQIFDALGMLVGDI